MLAWIDALAQYVGMSRHLQFGFETTPAHERLFVDVPTNVYQATIDDSRQARSVAQLTAKSVKALEIVEHIGERRVYINAKRIGNGPAVNKEPVIRSVLDFLNTAQLYDYDPALFVDFGLQAAGTSRDRLAMYAKVRWPEAPDAQVAALATRHMLATAEKSRYQRKQLLPGSVYAQVDRRFGITLETNEVVSCGLTTDGGQFDPIQPFVELEQTNIYSHEQQLICLAGAIAIAHADELLSTPGSSGTLAE